MPVHYAVLALQQYRFGTARPDAMSVLDGTRVPRYNRVGPCDMGVSVIRPPPARPGHCWGGPRTNVLQYNVAVRRGWINEAPLAMRWLTLDRPPGSETRQTISASKPTLSARTGHFIAEKTVGCARLHCYLKYGGTYSSSSPVSRYGKVTVS